MITVNSQNKNLEPLTTIPKFNINKAKWHVFTSNETWKNVANSNRLQYAEALTEYFYKKKQLSPESAIPVIEIKKTSPSPDGAVNYKN